MPRQDGLDVFISYAHEDEKLRQALEKHLKLLGRLGLVRTWHDRRIVPGADWAGEIDAHLGSAAVVLLLVSADFIASDYCWAVEMGRAMERHQSGEARVVPIVVRDCDWRDAPFCGLQALPPPPPRRPLRPPGRTPGPGEGVGPSRTHALGLGGPAFGRVLRPPDPGGLPRPRSRPPSVGHPPLARRVRSRRPAGSTAKVRVSVSP